VQGFNGDPKFKGEVETADPATHKALGATGSWRSCKVWHLVSPGIGPSRVEFRVSEAQTGKGGGKAETGGDASKGCRSLILLCFYEFSTDRVRCERQSTNLASRRARHQGRPKPANLQDLAVFQGVSRALKRIRPTGKGSEPLPVIDFKQNLQKKAHVWWREGLLPVLFGVEGGLSSIRFAQRDR
jgi:hypothetical protein